MAQKKAIVHRSPLAVAHRRIFTLRWVTLKVLRPLLERGVEQSDLDKRKGVFWTLAMFSIRGWVTASKSRESSESYYRGRSVDSRL
ncbi:hypothetical protein GJ744_004368 [Endocarpon pusillum]|uniref:Uncharacterized protein n=1 Tax=Endocarpon pusillum TaxID=364733 RepID=A0A8H7ARI8_9EURO|nr:hypothetical protein GJ744_004368 [Endocarpon pusillum]